MLTDCIDNGIKIRYVQYSNSNNDFNIVPTFSHTNQLLNMCESNIYHPSILRYHTPSSFIAFSTRRHGSGVSSGNYSTLNINPYCGDDPECVTENRNLLAKILSIDPNRILLPHQVHDCKIESIDEDFLMQDIVWQNKTLEGIDALITSVPNICIGISTADCVPILLYDIQKNVCAAVHAGWRGTLLHIARKTINMMIQKYECSPADIHAIIGPSISLHSFEVGQEVYDKFKDSSYPIERISKFITPKWHLDLWEANRLDLVDANIPNENIFVSNICTYNNDQFFSARRQGIQSGRIYSGIMVVR